MTRAFASLVYQPMGAQAEKHVNQLALFTKTINGIGNINWLGAASQHILNLSPPNLLPEFGFKPAFISGLFFVQLYSNPHRSPAYVTATRFAAKGFWQQRSNQQKFCPADKFAFLGEIEG